MTQSRKQVAEFVHEKSFAAPVDTVWQAWTEPKLLARWYKPNPSCETSVLQHELRVGGVMLYEMRFPNMPPHRERWEFDVIAPPTRLRWRQTLVDADGKPIANARMPDWPKVMLTTIDLEVRGNSTLQRLTWQPYDASEAELACFRSMAESMGGGWAGGFANLEALLRDAG